MGRSQKYKERHGERFSADAVVRSLVEVGIPLGMAMSVTSRVLEAMINERASFRGKSSTERFSHYVYDAICMTPRDAVGD